MAMNMPQSTGGAFGGSSFGMGGMAGGMAGGAGAQGFSSSGFGATNAAAGRPFGTTSVMYQPTMETEPNKSATNPMGTVSVSYQAITMMPQFKGKSIEVRMLTPMWFLLILDRNCVGRITKLRPTAAPSLPRRSSSSSSSKALASAPRPAVRLEPHSSPRPTPLVVGHRLGLRHRRSRHSLEVLALEEARPRAGSVPGPRSAVQLVDSAASPLVPVTWAWVPRVALDPSLVLDKTLSSSSSLEPPGWGRPVSLVSTQVLRPALALRLVPSREPPGRRVVLVPRPVPLAHPGPQLASGQPSLRLDSELLRSRLRLEPRPMHLEHSRQGLVHLAHRPPDLAEALLLSVTLPRSSPARALAVPWARLDSAQHLPLRQAVLVVPEDLGVPAPQEALAAVSAPLRPLLLAPTLPRLHSRTRLVGVAWVSVA